MLACLILHLLRDLLPLLCTGFWKRSILGPLPRFRLHQNVVILLIDISSTYLEAAAKTDRFRFRLQNPGFVTPLKDISFVRQIQLQQTAEKETRIHGIPTEHHCGIFPLQQSLRTLFSHVSYFLISQPCTVIHNNLEMKGNLLNCLLTCLHSLAFSLALDILYVIIFPACTVIRTNLK